MINDALTEIKILVEQNPNDPEVLLIAADIFRSKKEINKAISYANKAIEVDSLFEDGYLFISQVLQENGLLSEAEKYLKKYEYLQIQKLKTER